MVPTVSSSRAAEAAVTYREQAPPPEPAPWVRCLWQLTVQGEGGPAGSFPTASWTRPPARDPQARPTLAEAAILAGYADQAHMTAECTRPGRPRATMAADDDR
jgi:hypothetical protein